MTPEAQARRLAEWLAAHPGAEPPADLDPDVIEAVYALRPDLAPAPRVSADDILGLVTEGPLAAPAPPLPSSLGAAPAAVAPANRPRWRRPAAWGGVIALAAAALLTVRLAQREPMAEAPAQLAAAPSVESITTSPADEARGPAAEPARTEASRGRGMEAPSAREAREQADAIAQIATGRRGEAGGAATGTLAAAPPPPPPDRDAPAPLAAAQRAPAMDDGLLAAPSGAGEAANELELDAVADLDPEPPERSRDEASSAEDLWPAAGAVAAGDNAGAPVEAEATSRRARGTGGLFSGRDRAAAEEAPAAPASTASAPMPTPRPATFEVEMEAGLLEARAQWRAAADLLAAYADLPPPDGPRLALRAAENYERAGDPAAVIQIVDRRLALGVPADQTDVRRALLDLRDRALAAQRPAADPSP
jgi:hypothetical protein